jgi:AraC-like DNA-binding protein
MQPVAKWMRANGLSVATQFETVGLPVELLDEVMKIIPGKHLWALFHNARETEGIVDVGFRIGASHHVTDLPNIASVLNGRPTLYSSMQAFCSLLRSHANYWDYWIEPSANGVRFCRRGPPLDIGCWPVEQYVVSYLIDLVRTATDCSWWPVCIWLQRSQLHKEEEDWLQPARIHCCSRVTAIYIPSSLLSKRPSFPNSLTHAYCVPISRAVVNAVRDLVESYLPFQRIRLGDLAEIVDIHPRTLQRDLTRQGTSLRKLLNEVRIDLACTRLESNDGSISEIAHELGYDDIAAFSKAFRHWSGVSPSAYRLSNRPGEEGDRLGERPGVVKGRTAPNQL